MSENITPEPPKDPLDELQAKLEAIGEKPIELPKVPDLPTSQIDRIAEIERESKAMKGRVAEHLAPDGKTRREMASKFDDTSSYRGLGYGLSIAYTLMGTPILGYGIGLLIDRGSGKNTWSSILTVTGAALGLVIVIFKLQRMDKNT